MPKKSKTNGTQAENWQEQLSSLQQKLKAKEQQARDYLDGWKRERAAFENFKKGLDKRQELRQKELVSGLAQHLLPVLDSFEEAQKNLKGKHLKDDWIKGILHIKAQLKEALEKIGVEEIEVKRGDEFDPRRHEAVGGTGSIVEKVLQAGFRFGDWTIRPAKVTVQDKKDNKAD